MRGDGILGSRGDEAARGSGEGAGGSGGQTSAGLELWSTHRVSGDGLSGNGSAVCELRFAHCGSLIKSRTQT